MTNLAVFLVWTNLVTGLCEWTGDRQTAINSGYAYSTSAVIPEVTIAPAPELHPYGIETPMVVLTDIAETNRAYGYYSISGELVGGILDHASPRDPAAIAQRIKSNRLERIQLRRDSRSVRTNMVANIQTMQGAAALTNGFTATQNRALINDIRRELIDTQQEVRDLTAILRKMLKDSEP